jgi:hypothetical protein
MYGGPNIALKMACKRAFDDAAPDLDNRKPWC